MTSIEEELEEAISKLEQTERKLQLHRSNLHTVKRPRQRLRELTEEVDSLELVRTLAEWIEGRIESPTLVQDAQQCVALGKLLTEHADTKLLRHVFENEYEPLYHFVLPQLRLRCRQSLRKIKYPSKEASSALRTEMALFSDDESSIISCTIWLTRLQITDEQVRAHVSGIPFVPGRLESVIELCRPIVERVTFHFLQESEDRISSTRIDRLPEWVLYYIRENVFLGGPWEFVEHIASVVKIDDVMSQFLNEICQLASYVIIQRNFFRHNKIVGPRSTPILLSGAIEQLLAFDAYIRDLVVLAVYPMSLSQTLVADDGELWSWFITSECRWALSTLFDTPVSLATSSSRVSSRAELFAAIIHSIQSKSVLFAKSSSYIAHVGVPLCQSFLDAIHESSTDLRGHLGQRKLISSQDLEKNLESWIDLINGTHTSAYQLNPGNDKVDNDLSRVGRSMERLRDALVDECATTLVETVVTERAKLASYMMRCSHMLALDDAPEDSHELSPDLHATATIVWTVLRVCNDGSSSNDLEKFQSVTTFAPSAIKRNVLDRLAEKFLEIAVDAHGMTPEITVAGANYFHRDILDLFGDPPHPPLTMRLFDVTSLMAMDPKQFRDLKNAISDLVLPGQFDERLYVDAFEEDGTVLDEAVSMIRAKGFLYIYLEEALSIFNRRKTTLSKGTRVVDSG